MSYTPQAVNDYIKNKYDRVSVVLPAGARAKLQQLAREAGISVNRYILEAVEARAGVPLALGADLPQIAAARARKAEQRGPGAQGAEQPQITEQAAGDDPAR